MSGEMLLLQVGAAFLLYLILKNRLNAFVHPLRMRLADLGAAALEDKGLSDRSKASVEFQLDNAYNGRVAWAFVLLLPFAAVKSLIDSIIGREKSEPSRGEETAIMVLATISVFATSPIAAFLFAIEVLLVAVLFLPLGGSMRIMERILEKAEGSWQNHHHRITGH